MVDSTVYGYAPVFDERKTPALTGPVQRALGLADRAPADYYVFDNDIRFRVNLALVTGRPLLVRGPSGCGKSSLARAIAARAQWNFVEQTVGSRTQAQDLLYEIDHFTRLQDSMRRDPANPPAQDGTAYILPGPLFWAFQAREAAALLRRTTRKNLIPGNFRPVVPWVVLVDEIDKADPDVPNNLLVPLGALEFQVPELGKTIAADPKRLPLLILTTNEERDLPPAFLRRCVELVITEPDKVQLVQVGQRHRLETQKGKTRPIDLEQLAGLYLLAPRPRDQKRNTAEFLDFVRAWRNLELTGDQATCKAVLEAIIGRGPT